MSKGTTVLLLGALAGAIGLYQFGGSDESDPASGTGIAKIAGRTSPDSPLPPVLAESPPAADPANGPASSPAAVSPVGAAPPASEAAPAPSIVAQAPKVDETALRYFARQGDQRRLEAEIARLRALYPDWTPPADPLAVVPQTDAKLDAMWQLYSQGKYAELRKSIAERRTTEPNWQPPQDLLDRLAVAEARERLVNASGLQQYDTVVRVASDTPSLLTCSDVDVLWRVAEAFARTQQPDRARDAYLYILKNCEGAAERLGSVQKALPLLPRPQLDELLATEKTGPDGAGEFASVRADLVRSSVSAGVADPPSPVPPADVTALEGLADKDKLASDASLLGWYYLRDGNSDKAQNWFAKARATQDSAQTSQGLALALIGLGRPGEAENVLYEWRDTSDEVRKTYLAAATNLLAVEPVISIDPAILQRIVPEVAEAKDAAAAQQLGWYAHAFGQEETAAEWFSAALRWKPDDEPSAYGLAVVRMALRDRAGVAAIQREWRTRSERIATITDPQIETAALPSERRSKRQAAKQPKDDQVVAGGDSPAAFENQRDTGSQSNRVGCSSTDLHSQLSPDAALARGWCLMELNRPVEAAMAFEKALESRKKSTRRDAAYGQSLAYIRSGLTDKAAVAAAKEPQGNQRSIELEATILSMRASGFFEKKRYAETILALDQRARVAPERLDLMTLRGYAFLGLRRIKEARQIFEALRNAGDPEGQRGLAAIQATIDPLSQD